MLARGRGERAHARFGELDHVLPRPNEQRLAGRGSEDELQIGHRVELLLREEGTDLATLARERRRVQLDVRVDGAKERRRRVHKGRAAVDERRRVGRHGQAQGGEGAVLRARARDAHVAQVERVARTRAALHGHGERPPATQARVVRLATEEEEARAVGEAEGKGLRRAAILHERGEHRRHARARPWRLHAHDAVGLLLEEHARLERLAAKEDARRQRLQAG